MRAAQAGLAEVKDMRMGREAGKGSNLLDVYVNVNQKSAALPYKRRKAEFARKKCPVPPVYVGRTNSISLRTVA